MAKFPTFSIHQFDENRIEHELYVNAFADHLARFHADILRPHKHDFYLSVLFTKGSGFHEIDFRRYDVRPGSVFFMQPGQTHYWEFSKDIEGIIFFHSPEYYTLNFPNAHLADFPFFFSRQHVPYIQLSAEQLLPIERRFGELLAEFGSSLPKRYQKIASLLNCIYIDLSRAYDAVHGRQLSGFQRYAAKFRAFEKLIDQHYETERSPAFYAEKLNMTTKHLNRISRESVGKTSTEVILGRVMLEAKRLLSAGGKNLNEIAEELGYEEYAYFSRQFRQYCGENPREFGKRYV